MSGPNGGGTALDWEARLATLSPEKRALLERRLAREGLSPPGRGRQGGRTIPRRAEGAGPWPLSYGQRRLWFIDRLNPGTPAYNIPFAGRLAGPLHAGLLARALAEVVRRHQVLRSRFVEEAGRPVQVIDPHDPGAVRLPLVDLSRLPEARRDGEARRLTEADPQLPFDLARGPVVRMTLLRLAPGLHDLLVTMPHLVTDAWSMAVLFRELPALYDSFRHGRPSPLAEPPVQVADFAIWERERLDGSDGQGGGRLDQELDFWRRHLAGTPTVLELPTDRPRPPVQTMRGIRRAVAVPAETTRRLEALADREGATPFMALLASFAGVLARWTGQDDLLLASPLATRGEPEVQGLIGFFIDNAVLRADLSGGPSFRELLGRVRESALATFAHQGVPFEKVAEAMGAGGDLSRPPLAQVNFVLQNVHIPAPEFEELSLLRAQQTDTRSSRFDLTLGLFEADGGLDGWLEYSTDLFDATTIARLERDWLGLTAAALARPDVPLPELPRLGPAARQQLLVEWNDTARTWPEAGVHGLVGHWAERSPDAVAVSFDGEEGATALTYAGLHRRSRRLARRLRAAGAGPGRTVAVALPRSPDLVVALLAILRAGSAYVPLDPDLPAARRASMAAIARSAVVVAPPGLSLEVPGAAVVAVPGDDAGEDVPALPGEALPGDALCYVLFTSGTTGEPRGVAVPHRAVVRLVAGIDAYASSGPGDALLAMAPLGFDASTFEVWGALGRGGRLALLPEGPLSLDALGTALARHRVTVLWLTAGLFHLAVDREPEILRGLRHLLAGGDVLSPGAVARVLRELPGVGLVNGYGPTEATTFTCCHRVVEAPGPGLSVPLGRPVPGTRVYVADRHLREVPPGVAGELVAGGAGIARGYRGSPAATAAAWVPDPFSGEPGCRLYRTGDQVRLRADGTAEFLGRIDRQVKVRGFRVEPREVEAALAEHPAVGEAAVDLRDGRLVAWVVAEPTPAGDPLRGVSSKERSAVLRGFLDGRLPEFAFPSAFLAVPELPLTANGKVDRERLPDPGSAIAAAAGEGAPSTAAEEVLAEVWREVLGLDRVGVHDRFFDLGGDSILAIRVISRAAEAGLRLEPRHLFEHPTVAGLAAVARETESAAPAQEAEVNGPVPLGPAQRWFLEGLAPSSPDHWNMALLLEPAVSPGLDRWAARIRRLLERHDMLRARFRREGERWRQEVVPAGGAAPVAAVDLSALPAAAAPAALERVLAGCQGSLDLAKGPLVRLVRVDLPAGDGRAGPTARLLLVAHHLVTDAVSLRILLEELARPEGAPPLPRTASYRSWAGSLEAWAASAEAEEEVARWQLPEPAGGPGASGPGGEEPRERDAETVDAALSPEATASLLERAGESLRARPDEILLAGLAAALAGCGPGGERHLRWVDLEVEGHGRGLPGGAPGPAGRPVDLSRTVGWFTALYPVRIDLGGAGGGGEPEPARVLRAVKEALRAVPAGGVGYAALRWSGAGWRRASVGRPEPEVSFNYLGRLDEALGSGGPFRLAPEPPGPLRHPDAPRARPLEVVAWVLDGVLRTAWTFDRRRQGRDQVAALAEAALAVVRELVVGRSEPALHPTDFPEADLDAESLSRLFGRLQGG